MKQDALLALLQDMSLEEKIGQLIQVSADSLGEGGIITGPTGAMELSPRESAMVGSVLGTIGAEKLISLQKSQMEKQPHHIPMLFMYDVINGYQTIFPIPLAQGCSFSPEMVCQAARIAAAEAATAGLHVTFSPMLDLVRDARWGRVMESPGEDPYLNSLLARAMVRGYQGDDLTKEGNIAACLKHFAGYGAPEGGRDYDNVELSERTLREDYLPAYAAAVDEGCRMAMTSFNTLDRIPSSGNKKLLRTILREEMAFDGAVISDYSAIEEMIAHGIAEDNREAAKLAIEAGVDIDMVSNAYIRHLADLIREGEVSEALLDEAVMRVLRLKNELGLFENPFKDADTAKEQALILCDSHREAARALAEESFVLLKNQDILPLSPGAQKIAVIGPYADSPMLFGSWSFPADVSATVTVRQGMEKLQPENVTYTTGCYMMDEGMVNRFNQAESYDPRQAESWLREATEAAKNADTVVLCLGENFAQTGEGGSRASLQIPKVQQELLRKVHAVNENIILILFSGRPLETAGLEPYAKAMLCVWFPGTEGGSAIANVLFGLREPRGRLSMSFPRSAGQCPVYYNHLPTGRPNRTGTHVGFVNGYIDESCRPQYPFGYGLSYTRFDYSPVRLSSAAMGKDGELEASVTITNTGSREGTETVQLYLRDVAGSVARPVRMLKGFQKVTLQPGESRDVGFTIREDMLRFYDSQMVFTGEPGTFEVHIAASSETENMACFRLEHT